MANGSVYVFNCSPFLISMSINDNLLLGNILGASVGSAPPYAPYQIIVGRYDSGQAPQGQAVFINGPTNTMIVQILDPPPNQENSNPINVPVNPPAKNILGQPITDLWLYLFHDHMLMFDTVGNMIPGYPVPITWIQPSQTAVEDFPPAEKEFSDSELCG